MHSLRPYQVAAIDRARVAFQKGARRIVLVSPTGSGKTTIAAEIARSTITRGGRVLWLVHRIELATQAARALESNGLEVGIVAASSTVDPRPDAPVQVGSIQTMMARDIRPPATLIVADECFVAGTPVKTPSGDVPIEHLRPGDFVLSVDHNTGSVVSRRVVRTFTSRSTRRVRIAVNGKTIVCTANHPFFVKGAGYAEAESIRQGHMLCMWTGIRKIDYQVGSPAEDLLQQVSIRDLLGDYGQDKSRARIEKDARKEPNAPGAGSRKNATDSQRNRTPSEDPRRERAWSDSSSIDTCAVAGLGGGSVGTDEQAGGEWISTGIQSRHRQPGTDDCGGSRWVQPLCTEQESSRQKERGTLAWARVESVEVFEQTGVDRFDGMLAGDLVYNLEVEQTHVYFAGGALAHNCHHLAGTGFATWVRSSYPDAVVIGLTATPERGDGVGLGETFQRLIPVASVRDLTAAGYLVPCEVIAPAEPLNPGCLAQRPVDAYLQHAAPRLTLVFAAGVKWAEQHAEEFRTAGVDTAVVHGGSTIKDRAAALDAFQSGRLPVLVNVNCLTEGTDIPAASCAILARGCGTTGLFLQIVGRILRPHPGKTGALLIDLRGVTHFHGHPADDRLHSLEGRGIRRADDEINQSYCRVCGAPAKPSTPCEECGAEVRAAKPPRITRVELVKYAHLAGFDDDKRARMFATLLRRSRSPQQARTIYWRMHGHWPSRVVESRAMAILNGGGGVAA